MAVLLAFAGRAGIRLGATEIVALDLTDPACVSDTGPQAPFFYKLFYAVCQRQSEIEIALARSHGVLDTQFYCAALLQLNLGF